MQTFLPSPSIHASAKMLDRSRLGKQRVEARDILCCCHRHGGNDVRNALGLSERAAGFLWKRYRNHPAVLMWVGHEVALCHYGAAMCGEWIARGYKDTLLSFFQKVADSNEMPDVPEWIGEFRFHMLHRAILLGKAWEALEKACGSSERAHAMHSRTVEPEKHEVVAWNGWLWYDKQGWEEFPLERDKEGRWPYYWPVTIRQECEA